MQDQNLLKSPPLTQPAVLPTVLAEPMQAVSDALASLEIGLGGAVQIRSITTSLSARGATLSGTQRSKLPRPIF